MSTRTSRAAVAPTAIVPTAGRLKTNGTLVSIKSKKNILLAAAVALSATGFLTVPAPAHAYPMPPLKPLAPQSPGDPSDCLTRRGPLSPIDPCVYTGTPAGIPGGTPAGNPGGTPQAPHDAIKMSIQKAGLTANVTVTNTSPLAGQCHYDAKPTNDPTGLAQPVSEDFPIGANGSHTFHKPVPPPGITYLAEVSCHGDFNGQDVVFGTASQDVTGTF